MLGISQGEKDGEFYVHFYDSAMVSGTVSRGYINIDGVNVWLSEEDKNALRAADKEAEEKRIKAYTEYVLWHEVAVAKQQREAWAKAFEEMNGGLLAILSRQEESNSKSNELEGVSWFDFEWKKYETTMKISFNENNRVGGIFVSESD